jgi:hypothetical protein
MALRMLSSDDSGYADLIRNGKANVLNVQEATRISEVIRWYARNTDLPITKHFVVAIKKMIDSGNYNHEEMVRKINMQPRSIVRCIDSSQYLQMFEEVYNYKSQNKVRFL